MPYFTVKCMITPEILSPAGVHMASVLSCSVKLFDVLAKVYRAQRLVGNPFPMLDNQGTLRYSQATDNTVNVQNRFCARRVEAVSQRPQS
jgi:hypothetical protein